MRRGACADLKEKGFMLRTLVGLLLVSTAAHAADITEQVGKPGEKPVIRIGGEFHPDDHKKFKDLAL
jgi:hypothetical protein